MLTWTALIAALIKFLPQIADPLEELFAKATFVGDPNPMGPGVAVRAAFAAARGQTYRWQVGKRAKLAVAERIAVRHSHFIAISAKDGTGMFPAMTAAEAAELELA